MGLGCSLGIGTLNFLLPVILVYSEGDPLERDPRWQALWFSRREVARQFLGMQEGAHGSQKPDLNVHRLING